MKKTKKKDYCWKSVFSRMESSEQSKTTAFINAALHVSTYNTIDMYSVIAHFKLLLIIKEIEKDYNKDYAYHFHDCYYPYREEGEFSVFGGFSGQPLAFEAHAGCEKLIETNIKLLKEYYKIKQ